MTLAHSISSTPEDFQSNPPSFEKLLKIVDVARYFGVEMASDKLLSFISRKGAETLETERCTIFLLDEKNQEIYAKLVFENDRIIRFARGLGIAGETISTGKIILIPEAYQDPRFNQQVDKDTQFKTRNILSVPLKNIDGKVIGCFQSVNKKSGAFDHTDEVLTLAFAGLAAVALESARARQEREEMQAQLVRAERLATLGQLTSTIIHDINNPLSVIQTSLELMKRKSDKPESMDRLATIVNRQVTLCRNMVQELLYFARGEKRMNFRSLPLDGILREIGELIETGAQSKQVSVKIQSDFAGHVYVDQDKITRAILNLFNNALEVLKPGSLIALDAHEVENGRIALKISDNGPGIPLEIRKTLFDAFVTHGKKHGTGLGLHIAREVAAQHRGRLWLNEAYSPGTQFVLEILTEESFAQIPDPQSKFK